MLVYGAMKVWCDQFPPISDCQLEAKYGDSSPMGLLWRFMQFSQPYTSATGIVEFTCGLLLICRRTTLLGALCSGAAAFQVFLLNMCFDVPVKLMSGHLVLMALHADRARTRSGCSPSSSSAGRSQPRRHAPLFGSWRWLNRAGLVAPDGRRSWPSPACMLYQDYRDATARGILAPENPAGRPVGRRGVRPRRAEGAVPASSRRTRRRSQLTPPKWQGGPGMPAVIRRRRRAGDRDR